MPVLVLVEREGCWADGQGCAAIQQKKAECQMGWATVVTSVTVAVRDQPGRVYALGHAKRITSCAWVAGRLWTGTRSTAPSPCTL
jgi:hypothetical protein